MRCVLCKREAEVLYRRQARMFCGYCLTEFGAEGLVFAESIPESMPKVEQPSSPFWSRERVAAWAALVLSY